MAGRAGRGVRVAAVAALGVALAGSPAVATADNGAEGADSVSKVSASPSSPPSPRGGQRGARSARPARAGGQVDSATPAAAKTPAAKTPATANPARPAAATRQGGATGPVTPDVAEVPTVSGGGSSAGAAGTGGGTAAPAAPAVGVVPAGVTRGPRSYHRSVVPPIVATALPTAAVATAVATAATSTAAAATGCPLCAFEKAVADPSYAVGSPAARMQATPAGRQVNATISGVLGAAANWVSGLPGGQFQDFLAGAVLMARRQWADASSQTLGVTSATSAAAVAGSTGDASAADQNVQGWQVASMVQNLKVTQTAPGVFALSWDAPALPTLPNSVLTKWGIAPGIEVVSYTVTMKQDLINPYANDLQTGFPSDGSTTQNGDNTAWLAGFSNATTAPSYPVGTTGPFGTGAYTIAGLSNGPVSFSARTGSQSYTTQGTISAPGTTPSTFTGNISGTTMTVTALSSGAIPVTATVVAGSGNTTVIADNTTITGFDFVGASGPAGGVGNYTLSNPANGASGILYAGQGGTSLQLSLPPGVVPTTLVGASVTGANVAPGTTITSYTSSSGDFALGAITSADGGFGIPIEVAGVVATFGVSTQNLVGAEPITLTTSSNLLTVDVPATVDPKNLVGLTITGQGVAANTIVSELVSDNGAGTVTYTINNAISSPAGASFTITAPNFPSPVIPGQTTVLTAAGVTSYIFDMTVGLDLADTTCKGTTTNKKGKTEGGCSGAASGTVLANNTSLTTITPDPYARMVFEVVPNFTAQLPNAASDLTGKISGNTLTVTKITGNPLATGSVITGKGVTAGTTVTGQLSTTNSVSDVTVSSGGTGTYSLSGAPQTVGSEAMTASSNQGVPNVKYWSGIQAVESFASLFLDPTAMLSASDGSVWVAYQRSPLAKIIHRVIGWMDPYNKGYATTLTGYISNEDGTGPGDYLTVTGCSTAKKRTCDLPGGGVIKGGSKQQITLQTGEAWGDAPTYGASSYNLLVGKAKPVSFTGAYPAQASNHSQQFKLFTSTVESTTSNGINVKPTVDVATGTAADWKVPVQLVATPTKLVGGWGGFLKFAVGTGSILTGNFKEFKKFEQSIENLPPEAKLTVLQALNEPLPEDQVRQYKFIDGSWQMVNSFVTTLDGTNSSSNCKQANGDCSAVVIPHALVESADGQIFVASRGLPNGVNSNNRSGWARFAPNLSDQVGYVQRLGGEQITFTGNIGPGNAGTASFTGGISDGKGAAGDILNVAGMSAGSAIPLAPGEILTAAPGTTIAPGTQIKQQLTALVNGAQVPVSQVVGIPFTGTINNGTAGNSGSVLTVSSISGPTPIAVGQVIAGADIAAGTTITAQTTGNTGGPGSYTLSGTPQSITSTAMTASANCGSAGAAAGCTTAALGGAGTYKLRAGNGQLVAASTQMTGTYPGSILAVTAMGADSNPIVVGQTISVPGLAEGTRIIKQLSGTDGGVGTYLITGTPTVVASTTMSQLSAQTIDLSGTPTWGTFAAAPDGSVWVGIDDLGNTVGNRNAKRVLKNGAIEQIAPTSDGSWATQPVKYEFMHPPAGLAITPTSGTPPVTLVGSISGTTLTVSQIGSGAVNDANQFIAGAGLAVGQYLTGAGVGAVTTITKQLTGTGGVGTYEVSSPVGNQTVGTGSTTNGHTGIDLIADTYALWVNDSESNGRDATLGELCPVCAFGANGGSAGGGFGLRSVLNAGGTLHMNNSQDFKLKSTIVRIDSSCPDSSCGNRQDVGRGAMGLIAEPGQDAILAAVGTTSLLSELGYGVGYWGCRVAAGGDGGKACKAAGAGGQVVLGSISKLWKQGSGEIVEVTYNPNAYQADNGGSRTNGLDFLKVTKTLDIPSSWLGTSELLMQDAGRPQSLAMGPDGSIYMGGRGSDGAERSAFLGDFSPLNFFGSGASFSSGIGVLFVRLFAEAALVIDEINVEVCEDVKGGTGCANQSSFTPVRNAYDWKSKGSPSFVAQVWTPADGLLSTPGDPIEMGPIPRIQTFGQVYPFTSPVTVDPKTGLPTGAPEGIFAQNSQFGGAVFLPTTPVTPSGLTATSLVSGANGDSTTLTWKPPATPKRSPVISYTATACAGDTCTTAPLTAGNSATFTGLETDGGTTYYTVGDTNYFGSSSGANGQSAGGQLWLSANGTALPTKGLSVGMVSDGTPFTNGGLDRNGHAYSWDAISGLNSTTLSWNGVSFGLGSLASLVVNGAGGQQTNQPNVVRSQGQTISLSQALQSAQIDTAGKGLDQAVNVVNLAGAAVNGAKANQSITLNYTDGTSETWTQSFSDWCTPDYNPNEGIVSVQSYRDSATGGPPDTTTNYIYGYSHPIAQGKTLESVTLPDAVDVVLVGLAMSTAIAVSLGQNVSNSPLNKFGITTPPWQVGNHQGFDGNGNYYDAYNLNNTTAPAGDVISKGNPPPKEIIMSWAGSPFQVGQIPTSNSEVGGKSGPRNVAEFKGQTIYMPSGTYTNVQMIGAGANGTQSNQTITVNFTDNTTDTWTQTFSDWSSTPTGTVTGSATSGTAVADEAVMNGGTQINQLGNTVNRTANVYGYSYVIPSGKTVQSLTLPTNSNVGILGISLVGTPSVAPWSGVGIVTDGTAIASTGDGSGLGFDGDGNSYSWNLLTGQSTPASSNFTATINNGVAPATFTGSINNGQTATFLGGISSGTAGVAGNTLAVFQVANGSTPLAVGQFISAAGVAEGTAITGQLSYGTNGRAVAASTPAGLLGGAGTYTVSVPQSVVAGTVFEASQAGTTVTIDGPVGGGAQFAQFSTPGAVCSSNCPMLTGPGIAPGTTVTTNMSTSSGFTGTVNNGAAGSPGTTLTVTRITGTPLAVGQVVTGGGVAAGTTITGQLSAPTNGSAGGLGTYSLSGAAQSIGSTAMTATQYRYSVSGPAQWIAPSTPMSVTAQGNTLTVSSVTGGTITVGQTIGGANFYTQTNASYTASINNGQLASFTGSISNGTAGDAGNNLSVTSVTGSTPVAVGQLIAGNGVTVGTEITGFVSGTNGGVGTYTISGAPQSVAASTAMTAAQPGTTLTVSSIATPVGAALEIGQAVTGPGVAPGTTIAGLGTGSGGVGTYTISGPPQWVAPSTALTTTQPGQPLVADNTTITGFVSGTNGGPGVYTVSGSPQAVPTAPMAGNTKEPLSTLVTTTPWNGVGFEIGGPNKPNILRGDGQSIYGSYINNANNTQTLALAQEFVDACNGGGCVINLAAAGTNGGQQGNTLVLNYSDGTSDSISQSYSDWSTPVSFKIDGSGGAIGSASFSYTPYAVNSTTPTVGMLSYPGEWVISSQAYRDTASGATQDTKNYVYGYSYWVPEGKTPVSITLPADQNVGVLSISATKPTKVDLSTACSGNNCYNALAIWTPPFNGNPNNEGVDNNGNYFNASNLDLGWAKGNDSVPGTIYMTWAGVAFQVDNIPDGGNYSNNVVQVQGTRYNGFNDGRDCGGVKNANCSSYVAPNQVIDLPTPPAGTSFSNLYMAAAGNGTQNSQQFTLTFTDGTTSTWTQTISSWSESNYTPGSVSGEVLINAGTQINSLGNQTGDIANVYGYTYAIPEGQILKSITLPLNPNNCDSGLAGSGCSIAPTVSILGMSLL